MENSYDNKKSLKTQAAANNLNTKIIQNKAKELQDNRPGSVLQKKANNTGLPENLKSGLENISGHSMDDVKVHYNSGKPAQLQAHAYAQGTDIHIASGQEKHLPHEAWHVVQQKQGRVKPTLQMKGKVNVNDDKGLEKEADIMGAKAVTVQRKENASAHNAGCGCAGCNPTSTANKSTDVSTSGVYQLVLCGSCHQNNSHAPTCKNYKAPKKSGKSKKVKEANIVGGSHNRGGYQKSGAGGDQHQDGFKAAVDVEKRTGFYAKVREAKKKK